MSGEVSLRSERHRYACLAYGFVTPCRAPAPRAGSTRPSGATTSIPIWSARGAFQLHKNSPSRRPPRSVPPDDLGPPPRAPARGGCPPAPEPRPGGHKPGTFVHGRASRPSLTLPAPWGHRPALARASEPEASATAAPLGEPRPRRSAIADRSLPVSPEGLPPRPRRFFDRMADRGKAEVFRGSGFQT